MSFNDIDFNKKADEFLDQIKSYIDFKLSSLPAYRAAEILTVNSDGTVDVFFPPDNKQVFTKIQNQTIFQDLRPGDQVYLCYPKGNPSSCWVAAKMNKKLNKVLT